MQREQPSPPPEPNRFATCRSCTQPIATHGVHGCPGFLRPTATTFPSPTTVLCTCGVTYRYGAAHSCVLNGTFFTTPAADPRSLELEERNARSLQRIAVALEKLVRVFLPEE